MDPGADAALAAGVSRSAGHPTTIRASKLRRVLRRALAPEAAEGSLKQLLEAAPLEGIDLSRPRDFGREIDF